MSSHLSLVPGDRGESGDKPLESDVYRDGIAAARAALRGGRTRRGPDTDTQDRPDDSAGGVP